MHKISWHLNFSETLKGWPQKFSALWDKKNFDGKLWYPISAWNFSIPQIFSKFEGMPTKFFGTVRPRSFDGKTWYTLVCIEFFSIPVFLKHWGDAHENFWHCETENFRSKNVIRAISSIKLFETRNFLKNCKIPLRNFSALWDKNFPTENCDIPYYAKKFSIPQIFWNIEGMPAKVFDTVREKFFQRNIVIPQKCIKFSETLNYLKDCRDVHEIFRHCETKNFRGKNVITPFSSINFFGTRNFLKNKRIPLRKFSALWDIKISTETQYMPLLSLNFCRYQKISGKQKGLFKKLSISVLWDESSYKTVMPHFPMHANLAWKNFLKQQKYSLKIYFGTVRQKLRRKIVIVPPSPLIKTCSITEIIATVKNSPTEILALWDKKISTENPDTPPFAYPDFFGTRN